MYTGSFGAISNVEDWKADFSLINEDNSIFSVAGARILMRVCREGNSSAAVVAAQTDDNSITISGDGSTFGWTVPLTSMQSLRPDLYNVFVRMFINGSWKQLIAGTVTIVDGGPAS
jgi:hypothetical protein